MYLAELDALQRWIYATAALESMRLDGAPPAVSRPAILWEAPDRVRDRYNDRFSYVNRVTQYGKLYVASLDSLVDIQEKLYSSLEERYNVLPVYADEIGTQVVGKIKNVELIFDNSDNLDVPLRIKYEATYSRTKPAPAPNATKIGIRITMPDGGVVIDA